MNSKVKVLMEKELWTLRENPSSMLSGVGIILFIAFILILVPPTPLSSYTARRQILSNPGLFGLNERLINLLGHWGVRFGLLVAQIPMVLGAFIYVSVYSYLVNSVLSERVNKTMEVLFAAPIRESEIVTAKLIMSALLGVGLIMLAFTVNTLSIEAVFHHCTGLWWSPTRGYLLLITMFPPSFLALAFPIGLIVGLRGSKALMTSGSFVVFVPIALLILASRISVNEYFRLIFLVAVGSVILAVSVALASKRIINRLAFITN